MKPQISRSLLVGSFLGLLPLCAQERPPTEVTDAASAPATDVRVVGEIPDGSPSPPAEPKPRLVFQPEDILASRTKDLDGRQITFQKISPIELPPLPEPVPASALIQTNEGLEQMREHFKDRRFVFLGASAYVSSESPDKPRAFLRLWPNKANTDPIDIWVNANFLWLTGFAEFESGDTTYSLLMAISEVKVNRLNQIAARFGEEYDAPAPPDFGDDAKASFVVVAGNPSDEDLAPIRALVALYNSDKERLEAAYQGRMEAAAERAAELKANPPEKKNLVLKYWRMDRAGQEGATPKAADIR